MQGTLFLIPSSLGSSKTEEYLPNGVIGCLHSLKLFFAEDLRTARRFIRSTGYPGEISQLTFYELNEHTRPEEIANYPEIIREQGEAGLISEAGLPAVADPGAQLVALCHRAGIIIKPLTGPSSIMLALMASGMNGQQFTFHGYLPRDPGARKKSIRQLEVASLNTGISQIFMETPYRNQSLLKDLLGTCRDETWLTIAAGLTTEQEMIGSRPVGQWKTKLPDIHKIPAIFILGIPQDMRSGNK